MKENKTSLFDVRTLLFLDIVIMVFMLISGKAEVTLCSFIVAAAVPVITELNLFGNFSFRTGCLKMRYGVLLCYTVLFAVLFSYYQLILHVHVPMFQSAVFSVIGIVAFIVQRIIPFMLLGTVIQKQKNISEITMALDRMRLPRGVILSIAVMFRYFPAIKDDFLVIIDAMKLKGLYTSKRSAMLHPIRTMEFIIVPMLFKSLKTAEELSCAALVKGIENTGKKTSYFDVKLRPVDAVFSLAVITVLTASMYAKLF
ncbi:energy-coupling factor transporter transmembrane component T [Treponema sp. Marseille-Q3903]|uniref:energy-coupling factor transporter transmembrane component T n=1 Tax=Treponema sp. Marseille-Q3903 TaxID=2766703 RepID=UPI0016528832|nr:energy-coupling factor transporter transmembrane component T [Treponema sp. Marseille-Q3903]MBC6714225.1 energy-coupling factor transporter transmembrane protein EcfT [Treponema sp. Marseille-Q3903]